MACQNYHDEDDIDEKIFDLPNGRKIIFTRGRILENNNCAWLTVGQKRPAEKSAEVITVKFTVKGLFIVINQFLLPVGCVEKGFKVQFKFAVLVVEKKIKSKLAYREKKAKRNFRL